MPPDGDIGFEDWTEPMGRAYFAPMALAGPWVVSSQLCTAMQQVVNEAAETALVGRRVLDVMHSAEPVPSQTGMGPATQQKERGVWESQAKLEPAGILLWKEFSVDLMAARQAEREPERAQLASVVEATLAVARAEDERVFGDLIAAAGEDRRTAGEPIAGLLAAASRLRRSVSRQSLAAVVEPEVAEKAAQGGQLADLSRVFTEGVWAAPLPGDAIALALAPGRRNAYIVVGLNYRVDWLGWEPPAAGNGPGHKFSISVGLATVVPTPAAIEVVVP